MMNFSNFVMNILFFTDELFKFRDEHCVVLDELFQFCDEHSAISNELFLKDTKTSSLFYRFYSIDY